MRYRDILIVAVAALVILALVEAAGVSLAWGLAGLCVIAITVAATRPVDVREAAGSAPPARAPAPAAAGRGLPSVRLLGDLIETLPDPFLVLDSQQEILLANQPARAVFEMDVTGRHVSAAIRAPMVLEAIDHTATAAGRATVDYEQRVPIERRFEVHIAPIAADGQDESATGQPALAVLLRDLTQQERVERMRADFVSNASHELRTPLASVLGFIETLQGAARNDDRVRDEFLELMRGQAARMARLIDDLLSLNRIEINAHLQPNESVELNQVIGHVVDMLARAAQEAAVELVVTAPETPMVVRGDRDELVQVFQNLVENALKYGASGKRVDIVGEFLDGGDVRVTVRDYGPGIAPEHVPRLTERFYRADVADSRQKGGTGLGLAIVKHILNRHRARLTIRSELGEGASFIVELPAVTKSD